MEFPDWPWETPFLHISNPSGRDPLTDKANPAIRVLTCRKLLGKKELGDSGPKTSRAFRRPSWSSAWGGADTSFR